MIARRDARASGSIRYRLQDWVVGSSRILYRHCQMTSSSAVKMDAEFLRRNETILLSMVTLLLCLSSSVNHRIGLVN